jgi:hypothetical protein
MNRKARASKVFLDARRSFHYDQAIRTVPTYLDHRIEMPTSQHSVRQNGNSPEGRGNYNFSFSRWHGTQGIARPTLVLCHHEHDLGQLAAHSSAYISVVHSAEHIIPEWRGNLNSLLP